MTTLSVAEPQVLPVEWATHAPSKLPPPALTPPPPSRSRAARRGFSAGLLRRAGFSVSTDLGACREPDTDFSSLPMLPPALPDCASAVAGPIVTANALRRAIRIGRRMDFGISIISNESVSNQRPEPSAHAAPIMRQDLPVLPHSSSAASLAFWTVSRATSDHDCPEIAKAPQLVP